MAFVLLSSGGLRRSEWRGYLLSVEEDLAWMLEKATRLIAEAMALERRVQA